MSVIYECKKCGKPLKDGVSLVCSCEACGLKQTVPEILDGIVSEKFNKANALRISGRYTEANEIYKELVNDYPDEPEGYWGETLSKYGIKYLDNGKIKSNRVNVKSITECSEYLLAVQKADSERKKEYSQEAERIKKQIEEQDTLSRKVVDKAEIYICFNEKDENGNATIESMMAQSLCGILNEKGYNVLLSTDYPASKSSYNSQTRLSKVKSAKKMILLSSDEAFLDQEVIKNEWMEFVKAMNNDGTKRFIPCLNPETNSPTELKGFSRLDILSSEFLSSLIAALDNQEFGKNPNAVSSNNTTTHVEQAPKSKKGGGILAIVLALLMLVAPIIATQTNFSFKKKVYMPDLANLMLDEAEQLLNSMDINSYSVEYQLSDTYPEEQVMRTVPLSGTELEDNTLIKIYVSDGLRHNTTPLFQVQIRAKSIYKRSNPSTKDAHSLGFVYSNEVYDVFETKQAEGYTWYRIAENIWVANDGIWIATVYGYSPRYTNETKMLSINDDTKGIYDQPNDQRTQVGSLNRYDVVPCINAFYDGHFNWYEIEKNQWIKDGTGWDIIEVGSGGMK